MNTTDIRTKFVTAVLGAVVAGAAAPALLFLGAGTAHALQNVSERGAIASVADLPTPRTCPSCVGFDPQPDPPRPSDRFNPSDGLNPSPGLNQAPDLGVTAKP